MLSELRRIATYGKGAPRKRTLVCILHVVLWPLFAVASLFWPRRKPAAEIQRILLIRMDGIGDLAMSAAIFPSLRRRYPGARIDLLTSDTAEPIAELFVAAGWVDKLRVLPLLGRRLGDYRRLAREFREVGYDAAADLRGDMRTAMLMWAAGIPVRLGLAGSGLTYLLTGIVDLPDPHHQAEECAALVRRLDVQQVEPWPRIPLQPENLAEADRWLAERTLSVHRPICAFHLGSLFASKIWPLDRFVGVAKRLILDLGAQIVVLGSEAELGLAQSFAAQVGENVTIATGATRLQLTVAILARCTVFIGNDSGPAHLAAGVGCPAVVIFGRGHPGIYRPLSPRAEILVPSHPCCPGCNVVCMCPQRWCILDHTVDAVAEAAEQLVRQFQDAAPSGSERI